ncbi:hypothetical protein [Desulfovibrio ferrophilus]|uniref:Uncharacterized protein n=1 Tax=Desulfovibrio ferrophilus TaxID=241368 RepID=A0A2Z6AW52_9BACT|nr:hypothetical protein [Desulfovibrio ferrophilus]BBD07469.1 uncharacterized protein DFE_0743 [Desulfovibrio ferrophilus]
MPQPRLVISFPQMHPRSRPEPVSGVTYLDPGLAPEDAGQLMPEALPLTRAEAAGWLAQAVGYADLFRKPGELLAAYTAGGNDFYSETAHAIVSELRAMDKPREDDAQSKELIRAQALLLLSWQREQSLMEIGSLDNGVEASWDGMGEALGLEPDDAAELAEVAAHIRPDLHTSLFSVADEWLPVLDAMLRLIPAQAALYVDDAGVLAHWRELGLKFVPAEAEDCEDLPEGEWQMLRATGYDLLGAKGDAAEFLAERLVFAPAGVLDAA